MKFMLKWGVKHRGVQVRRFRRMLCKVFHEILRIWAEESVFMSAAHIHCTHHLMVRMLHEWRAQRRFELRRVKQARIARRWFIKRACWSKWRSALEHRNRERRLQRWHLNLVKKVLIGALQPRPDIACP